MLLIRLQEKAPKMESLLKIFPVDGNDLIPLAAALTKTLFCFLGLQG
jgi:hypothetical protein